MIYEFDLSVLIFQSCVQVVVSLSGILEATVQHSP